MGCKLFRLVLLLLPRFTFRKFYNKKTVQYKKIINTLLYINYTAS